MEDNKSIVTSELIAQQKSSDETKLHTALRILRKMKDALNACDQETGPYVDWGMMREADDEMNALPLDFFRLPSGE